MTFNVVPFGISDSVSDQGIDQVCDSGASVLKLKPSYHTHGNPECPWAGKATILLMRFNQHFLTAAELKQDSLLVLNNTEHVQYGTKADIYSRAFPIPAFIYNPNR